HTRWPRDWSSDVCSSDLIVERREPVSLDLVAEDVDEAGEPVDRAQMRPQPPREEQRGDGEVLRPRSAGDGSHIHQGKITCAGAWSQTGPSCIGYRRGGLIEVRRPLRPRSRRLTRAWTRRAVVRPGKLPRGRPAQGPRPWGGGTGSGACREARRRARPLQRSPGA